MHFADTAIFRQKKVVNPSSFHHKGVARIYTFNTYL